MFTELNLATREGYSHNLLKINKEDCDFHPFQIFSRNGVKEELTKLTNKRQQHSGTGPVFKFKFCNTSPPQKSYIAACGSHLSNYTQG